MTEEQAEVLTATRRRPLCGRRRCAALRQGFSSLWTARSSKGPPIWLEEDNPGNFSRSLQLGILQSRATKGYLRRIARLNPLVAAVIETTHHAIALLPPHD